MLLEFVQWTNDGESLETTFGCYLGIEINIFICTHVGSLGQENSRKSLKNHHMSLNYAQPSVHSNAHYKTWIWPSFFLHHKQTFCSIKILSTDIPTVDKLQRVFFSFSLPFSIGSKVSKIDIDDEWSVTGLWIWVMSAPNRTFFQLK